MSPLRGIFVPLITPIDDRENVDHSSLERLVEYQIRSGVHGLWAMGTTAEFASFDEDERAAAVRTVIRAANGRVPVIANISDASTRLAIRHGKRAANLGADAIAATPPYYYPHSQDELLIHFSALRRAVDLPLFIYNIPQTVRVRVELSTAKELITQRVVSGIKDSQNDLEWFRALANFVTREKADFALFAGTRSLIDAAVLAGATGAIPSISNAFPELCVEAFDAAVAGNFDRAADAERRIMEAESHTQTLIPGSRNAAILGLIKSLLHDRGIIANPALTLPLRAATADERQCIVDAVAHLRPSAVGQ